MYPILKHLHSGVRWLVLFALLWAIYDAWQKWKQQASLNKDTRFPAFLALNLCHIQLLIGCILFFFTTRIEAGPAMMKDKVMRFFAIEHPLMMLLAVALITIGFVKAKKNSSGQSFRILFWYYLIALAMILFAIPWPFQEYATGWF